MSITLTESNLAKMLAAADLLLQDEADESVSASSESPTVNKTGSPTINSESLTITGSLVEGDGHDLSPSTILQDRNLDESDWDVKTFRFKTEFKNIKDDFGDTATREVTTYSMALKKAPDAKEFLPISRASTRPIRLKSVSKLSHGKGELIRALILPDPQIGVYKTLTGELGTIHDPDAMALAIDAAQAYEPDVIVNLGDFFDLGEWSTKYLTPNHIKNTTQASLEIGYNFLAMQRTICEKVVLIEGNHDARININLASRAPEATYLKQAGSNNAWPAMSLQHLLQVDELGVEWISGYPGAKYALRDDIVCMHGQKLSARDQASRSQYLYSTIFGHIHKIESQGRTFEGQNGEPVTVRHMSPGCLCRTDGTVPGVNSSSNSDGSPILQPNNWQQGFMFLDFYNEPGAPFSQTQLEVLSDGKGNKQYMYDTGLFNSKDMRATSREFEAVTGIKQAESFRKGRGN